MEFWFESHEFEIILLFFTESWQPFLFSSFGLVYSKLGNRLGIEIAANLVFLSKLPNRKYECNTDDDI